MDKKGATTPDEERGEADEETIPPKPGPESGERGEVAGPLPQGDADALSDTCVVA